MKRFFFSFDLVSELQEKLVHPSLKYIFLLTSFFLFISLIDPFSCTTSQYCSALSLFLSFFVNTPKLNFFLNQATLLSLSLNKLGLNLTHTPVIPVIKTMRQKNQEFKISLGYKESTFSINH